MFAGTDSRGVGAKFKLIHIGETLTLIDPKKLPDRLRAAGLTSPRVDTTERSLRFRAQRAP